MTRLLRLAFVAGLAWAVPATAHADLAVLTSGQVIAISGYRVDGDTAVLTLKAGGEARVPKAIIVEVKPNEVFDAVALPAPVAAPAAPADDLHALVTRLATSLGVDPKLAQAVVTVESNYQPRAVSSKGAMGLMQLMPAVVKDFALSDPFDPEQNVTAGLKYLKDLLNRFDVATALAAYNAGEGTVAKYGRIPPFAETRDYVQRVLALSRLP